MGMKNLNMTQELHGIVQGHVTDTLKDIGDLYNVTLPADLLKAEEEGEEDAGKEEEKVEEKADEGKEEKEDDKKEDEEKEEGKKEKKEEKEETKDSRLFDGSIPSIVRGDGSAVFACFFGGALVAAFGLVAMLRRRPSSVALRTEDNHEMLIAEDSEAAEAL